MRSGGRIAAPFCAQIVTSNCAGKYRRFGVLPIKVFASYLPAEERGETQDSFIHGVLPGNSLLAGPNSRAGRISSILLPVGTHVEARDLLVELK